MSKVTATLDKPIRIETAWELEEWQGEWAHVKTFESKKEAEEELKRCRRCADTRYRVIQRQYKVLYERSRG